MSIVAAVVLAAHSHSHSHLHRHGTDAAALRRNLSLGVHHLNSTAHFGMALAPLKAVLEHRRMTDLNRLTLACVLSMGAIISICAMVVIVHQRWAPAREGGSYQECNSRETTELVDQAKGLLGDAFTPPRPGAIPMAARVPPDAGAQLPTKKEGE